MFEKCSLYNEFYAFDFESCVFSSCLRTYELNTFEAKKKSATFINKFSILYIYIYIYIYMGQTVAKTQDSKSNAQNSLNNERFSAYMFLHIHKKQYIY